MLFIRAIFLFFCALFFAQAQAAFYTEVTEAQMASAMRFHFPAKEYASVARVELDYPQVSLSRDKGAIDITLILYVMMAGQERREGSVSLRADLSYKPASGELYLTAPKLMTMEVAGVKSDLKPALRENVNTVLQNVIPLIRIYRVKETDLNHSLDKSTLKSSLVDDGVLKLEFGFK